MRNEAEQHIAQLLAAGSVEMLGRIVEHEKIRAGHEARDGQFDTKIQNRLFAAGQGMKGAAIKIRHQARAFEINRRLALKQIEFAQALNDIGFRAV